MDGGDCGAVVEEVESRAELSGMEAVGKGVAEGEEEEEEAEADAEGGPGDGVSRICAALRCSSAFHLCASNGARA